MSSFISAVKKFFTDYSPGKRCFSSLCLLITGTYLIATLYWFCGGDRFTQIIGHALYFNRKDAFPWQVFLLLLLPLLLLNYLWYLAKLFVRASWFKFIHLLAAWGAASTKPFSVASATVWLAELRRRMGTPTSSSLPSE